MGESGKVGLTRPTRRVIACLDVRAGQVVKGVGFANLRTLGDAVAMARKYEREGADEIVLLDISATQEERGTHLRSVRETAEQLFVPLTVGGGVREVQDIATLLRNGADKVSVNSAAVARPELISEAAREFGSQCVVVAIDVRRENRGWGPRWRVYTHGGEVATAFDAAEWARECVERGAGEILLTSIDRDGVRDGYDLDVVRQVAAAVSVPVVASGGAGAPHHVVEVLECGADAALVAGILHDQRSTIGLIKRAMHAAGVPVRRSDD